MRACGRNYKSERSLIFHDFRGVKFRVGTAPRISIRYVPSFVGIDVHAYHRVQCFQGQSTDSVVVRLNTGNSVDHVITLRTFKTFLSLAIV